MFKLPGVGYLENKISHHYQTKYEREGKTGWKPGNDQNDQGNPGDVYIELAGGQRPIPFDGMFPVALYIGQVVHNINAAGNQTQQGKGQ